MNGDRPWAEWTYMVVGVVAWLAVTLIVAAYAAVAHLVKTWFVRRWGM